MSMAQAMSQTLASQLLEVSRKAREDQKAKLEPKFLALFEECMAEAEKGICVKEFPAQLDPLIVKMFAERGFSVQSFGSSPLNCKNLYLSGQLGLGQGCGKTDCYDCNGLGKTVIRWGDENADPLGDENADPVYQ
jgi:hypothetical protein